ncbi:1,4-alpha-glucan branching protein GlgB [Thermoanaerobacterium sp. RBIITD]|uniref:1,4-alpha-glucan branching protein GlgB n=1 Tax=Thermoanaerobacterium sp. RBIITD TaxID=1550240 RepID=UPI000BB724C2|nr:1,4-alpha-glucan branching protein GlgB [Thermoanaerobacterium sp. RBIITD]SNX53361.1 1,4-alpha-glucan branching enzyme [Thermoanaerobacterium sp. RBIITD]
MKNKSNTVTSTIYASDIKKFLRGENYESYKMLGSRFLNYRGKDGVVFCVWAPNAEKVGVAGDFNGWNAKDHMMLPVKDAGMWWKFIEGLKEGDLYKYEIHTKDGRVILKADPYAYFSEVRPHTASIVKNLPQYVWHDDDWMLKRKTVNLYESPINIYELHLGSWKRKDDGTLYNYRDIANMLVPYIKDMGYTYVEFLPLLEHPLDMSWGYQATGYFSVTSRFGEPEDFMYMVDLLHQNDIGVIMDWAPGHFCKDEHGLYCFDGTYLYEYNDISLRENGDWGTANFDIEKPGVQSFLISSALFWLKEYHIDGLRTDAVSNILYLKNRAGSPDNNNKSIVEFIQKFNKVVFEKIPNPLMIAEESSAYPLVTYPAYLGGLGFNYKWDMGWMNDTLKYMQLYPDDRKWNHNLITFSMMYAYSENFILPFSHDEVVHGKKSLLDKMPGEYDEKFANLRLLYGYMICHPGKKLLFMGGEFGQFIEWDFQKQLDWFLLDYPMHKNMQKYVKDLNHLYLQNEALWQQDHKDEGFLWIDANNNNQSIISFIRYAKEKQDFLITICNFSKVHYDIYRIGVPENTDYIEILNSDNSEYGGKGVLNSGTIKSYNKPMHGKPYSIVIKIPALSTLILKPLNNKRGEIDEKGDNSADTSRRTGE